MESLITVIIPAYNVEKFIGASIDSVLSQTCSAWELIIVNDGSRDNTLNIIQEYASQDGRISIIDQKNSGVSAARNSGLFAAKGRYVIFLDGDDYWKPVCLEKLVEAIENSGTDIVYCGYNRVYPNGLIRPYRYKYPSGDILIPPQDEPVQLHIGAMLFKKAFLDKHQLTFTVGGLIGQDTEMMQKAIALTKVQSVPMNLMLYRQRGGSALHSGWNWEKQIHALKGRKRAIDFIASKEPEVVNCNAKLLYLKKQLAYKSLRFLWRMLKTGAGADVVELLNGEEFSCYLRYLDIKALGFIDTLKYRVIMSKNQRLWPVFKIIK